MRQALAVALAVTVPAAAAAGSQPGSVPGIWLNETLVGGLYRDWPVDDPVEVFTRIFPELPATAMVYPTENYYYFSFSSGGRSFSGNFRLSPDARQKGRVHFAYFDTVESSWVRHVLLGPEHGVSVVAAGPMSYDVTYQGRTVRFELNDVPQVLPEGLQLLPNERFVGRSFDESGLRFVLLYDTGTKSFLWLLDEETFPLELTPLAASLGIDPRTFFIFHEAPDLGRRVLAGVSFQNVAANNFFDGPFDQLPDNWIAETAFAEYVLEAYPAAEGLVNRRGESPDGETRLAVTPYTQYSMPQDIRTLADRCEAGAGADRARFYACLLHDYKKSLPEP